MCRDWREKLTGKEHDQTFDSWSWVLYFVFSVGYTGVCCFGDLDWIHKISVFTVCQLKNDTDKSSDNFLIRILLVKQSRNPNWIDVFSPPWDLIKLFRFYLWMGKTDTVTLFNFPDLFLLYQLLTCTVLYLHRKKEVCPKAHGNVGL